MSMNKSGGNMYDWVTHTWNTVKGQCPHGCTYCYMRRWGDQPPARFDERELRTNLGRGNKIFVGSSCDLFAAEIPIAWINATLQHCYADHYENTYVFQSKNPQRMIDLVKIHRDNWKPYGGDKTPTYIGTTIESNIHHAAMGTAPHPYKRARAFEHAPVSLIKFVTVEPIMDFDPDTLAGLIIGAGPRQVNIGADSRQESQRDLPEPTTHKIVQLIEQLVSANIEVKQKTNLRRLMT